MTEIPEHLLKRAKQAREKVNGDKDEYVPPHLRDKQDEKSEEPTDTTSAPWYGVPETDGEESPGPKRRQSRPMFEDIEAVYEKYLHFFAMTALSLIDILYSGLVIMLVWNWFVPEIFENGPSIGIVEAIGLGILYQIFAFKINLDDLEDDFGTSIAKWILSMTMLTFFLVAASVVQLFLP